METMIHEGTDKNGKLWRWTFSELFGPWFLRKDGEYLINQPVGEKHPCWEPFEDWQKQTKINLEEVI